MEPDYIKPVTSVILGMFFASAIITSSAIAGELSGQGLGAADSFTEQQLPALSTPSTADNCNPGTPRSLSTFAQAGQATGSIGSATNCAEGGAAPTPLPSWTLYAGSLIGPQIESWGQSAGWHVIWQSKQDWIVPSYAQFHGSFMTVARQVLEDLAAEGASIHGVFYQGNYTLIVTGGQQ